MSVFINLAPGVETTLLSKKFTLRRSTVGGAAVAGLGNEVATYSDSGAVWIGCFWVVGYYNAVACYVFPSFIWDVGFFYKI